MLIRRQDKKATQSALCNAGVAAYLMNMPEE